MSASSHSSCTSTPAVTSVPIYACEEEVEEVWPGSSHFCSLRELVKEDPMDAFLFSLRIMSCPL